MPFTTVTLMEEPSAVRHVVDHLHAAGFTTDAISVVFPRPHHVGENDDHLPPDLALANHQTTEGAAIGAVTGTVIGSALAWLTGAGLVTVPGIGPLLAAGPFLTIFTGMGLGASLGGIAGALIGMGVSEIDAKRFASSISDGRILVAVRCDEEPRAWLVEDLMRGAGGQEVEHFRWTAQPRMATSTART